MPRGNQQAKLEQVLKSQSVELPPPKGSLKKTTVHHTKENDSFLPPASVHMLRPTHMPGADKGRGGGGQIGLGFGTFRMPFRDRHQ